MSTQFIKGVASERELEERAPSALWDLHYVRQSGTSSRAQVATFWKAKEGKKTFFPSPSLFFSLDRSRRPQSNRERISLFRAISLMTVSRWHDESAQHRRWVGYLTFLQQLLGMQYSFALYQHIVLRLLFEIYKRKEKKEMETHILVGPILQELKLQPSMQLWALRSTSFFSSSS